MTLGPEEVRRVARLAALEVPDADLAAVATELDQIVAYIGQLAELETASPPPDAEPAPSQLRPDVPSPNPVGPTPSGWAPEFQNGFFLVPRLEAME